MADKDKETASTAEGTSSNRQVGDSGNEAEGSEPEGQTPDQFFTGDRRDDGPVPKNHATKGMTSLGTVEASRIENTTEQFEAERKAAERTSKED